MDYVLFGIQGSGKGTQGKILAERLGAAYFETGGELRRLAAENSELGKKVKSIIDAGHLVPNEVVMQIVENFTQTKAAACAAVFDGIPRNAEQNTSFTSLLKKLGRPFTGIYFELSREEALNRLSKRRICMDCKTVYPASYSGNMCVKCVRPLFTRADDINPDSVRTRLDIFYKETLPIIEQWHAKEKMIAVNGAGVIDAVTRKLFSKLSL